MTDKSRVAAFIIVVIAFVIIGVLCHMELREHHHSHVNDFRLGKISVILQDIESKAKESWYLVKITAATSNTLIRSYVKNIVSQYYSVKKLCASYMKNWKMTAVSYQSIYKMHMKGFNSTLSFSIGNLSTEDCQSTIQIRSKVTKNEFNQCLFQAIESARTVKKMAKHFILHNKKFEMFLERKLNECITNLDSALDCLYFFRQEINGYVLEKYNHLIKMTSQASSQADDAKMALTQCLIDYLPMSATNMYGFCVN